MKQTLESTSRMGHGVSKTLGVGIEIEIDSDSEKQRPHLRVAKEGCVYSAYPT